MDYFFYHFGMLIGAFLVVAPFGVVAGVLTYFIKRNVRSCIVSGVIAIVIALLLLLVLPKANADTNVGISKPPMPENIATEIKAYLDRYCFTSQRQNAANDAYPDAVIKKFCKCYAQELVGELTQEQVDALPKAAMSDNPNKNLMAIYLNGREQEDVVLACAKDIGAKP